MGSSVVRLAARVMAFLVITVVAVVAAACSTIKASDLAGGPARCNGMAEAAAGGLCDSAGGGGGSGGM